LQNFRKTFAKISLSADPSHQQFLGAWRLEAWLLRLGFFFETSEVTLSSTVHGSTSGRYKDALQDRGIWLWQSLTSGSSAATY